MKLKLTILGFEVGAITLEDLHRAADATEASVQAVERRGAKALTKGVKFISKLWVDGMTA